VENAVRHGLEPRIEGGRIETRARREGQTLVLTVRDTGVGLAGGSGFGTLQVRERLATLFGGDASLRLEAAADAEGGTLATVTLPLPGST
jgi:LytS/YehU family sensor histidine kinase